MTVEDELLTVPEILAELRIPRSTWYQWRQVGKAPRAYKLPNGGLRIRRSVLNEWLASLEKRSRMKSYQIKVWEIKKREDARRSRPYRLRWSVSNYEFEESFRTKALANSFRTDLVKAANSGEPFDTETGQPCS